MIARLYITVFTEALSDLLPAYEKMYGNNYYFGWQYQQKLRN
jgi:hypothetical protein